MGELHDWVYVGITGLGFIYVGSVVAYHWWKERK